MAQRGMERRVAGIIRWLERFQSSYRSGALECALMDAECARADIEDLRLDIWSRVGTVRAPRRAWGGVVSVALSALVMLLATAAPLSRPLLSQWEALSVSSSPSTVAVEKDLPVPPAPRPVASVPGAKPAAEPRRRAAQGGASARRPVASVPSVKPAESAAAEKSVAYDKMFSLLQTGARALKSEESVIKIQEMGKGEGKL